MRKNLLSSTLFFSTLFITGFAQAQTDRFAYAITDVQQEGSNWSFLRKLDIQTGQFSDILLNGADAKQIAFDATSKKQLLSFPTEINRGYNAQPAFSSMVAAMAYDRKNNRIWYTPMFIDQLRYIDLKTMKVYYMTSQDFTGMAKKSPDQGNIITRMTIGGDGNGYAMTNDGAHLIRFSTGKTTTITDLGNLADDPAGKGLSIHSSCSSFGGDMIADNKGNLIVFSARNNVFKVNIETKIATHVGAVSGLPANFTSNGAVVTEDNKVLISSAVDGTSYLVDPASWNAVSFQFKTPWRSSDLANSNILNTTQPKPEIQNTSRGIAEIVETGSDLVQVYPNPVTNKQFAIQFTNLAPGEYTIQVTDAMGRQATHRKVNVGGTDQSEVIRLGATAKGFYLVKIMDKNSKAVFTKKLVVE